MNKNIEILEEMPNGWKVIEGTLTQPLGCVWISNGKSLFAKDKNGNRLYKHALLIVDKILYKDALEQEIHKQREENIRLYEVFQYRLQEESMQPIINDWRNGSKKLKEMLNQLHELEKSEEKSHDEIIPQRSEKESREITSSTYIRADRRLSKEIMSFIGG